MNISVVICTWNNSDRLKVTLESFIEQKFSNEIAWEIVLVNNNSNDSTKQVAASYKEKLPIVYVEEPTQGLSYARNSGLQNARGELIVFTDDDVTPCSDWLNTYWSAYQSYPENSFWGGPIESDFESSSVDFKLLKYAPASVKGLHFGEKERILDKDEYLIAANWACPSSVINRFGGFDVTKGLNPSLKKTVIGEEHDLMERIKNNGFSAVYLPAAKIRHFVPKSKTGIKHIAARARAWGNYCGEKEYKNLNVGRSAFGVPFWLYREMMSKVFCFCCGLFKLKIDYYSCLECCRLLGYMQAIRKAQMDKRF